MNSTVNTEITNTQSDKMLFWSVLILMGFGIAAVYSASSAWAAQRGGSEFYLLRHLVKVLVGVGLIIGLSKVDYHLYAKYSKIGVMIAVASLILLLITGGIGELKGANRWLGIGPFSFQPSELAKWTLIVHIAFLMSKNSEKMYDLKEGLIPCLIWIGSVVLLIALQPNFSTAAVISTISIIMLFVGGANLKYLYTAAAILIPLAVIYVATSPYRLKRILSFIDGDSANYQLSQSLVALGNGGLLGVGPGQSKQRDFFLPEPFNDFILPIIGEEYGYIGILIILALFIFILVRGVSIVKRAPDLFGTYLATGIVISIVFYAFTNAAVTCGLFPTTGLPMPFISYGGTSILFTSASIGILLNISKQSEQPNKVDA